MTTQHYVVMVVPSHPGMIVRAMGAIAAERQRRRARKQSITRAQERIARRCIDWGVVPVQVGVVSVQVPA